MKPNEEIENKINPNFAPRTAVRGSGKTVHQLMKIARRIPRIKSHCLHKLMKKGSKLSTNQREFYRAKLNTAVTAENALGRVIESRGILSQPVRDSIPKKLRRKLNEIANRAFNAVMLAEANKTLGADAQRVFSASPILGRI